MLPACESLGEVALALALLRPLLCPPECFRARDCSMALCLFVLPVYILYRAQHHNKHTSPTRLKPLLYRATCHFSSLEAKMCSAQIYWAHSDTKRGRAAYQGWCRLLSCFSEHCQARPGSFERQPVIYPRCEPCTSPFCCPTRGRPFPCARQFHPANPQFVSFMTMPK